MSETTPGAAGDNGAPGTTSPTGAGAMLRAAREKQGLHIAALAAAIKVSPRKLDALEHNRWHELPDATFTRALAQTVCRTLKIDARPVLDKLPPAASGTLEPRDADLNEPFRDRPGREDPGFAATAVRPMVWGAAALMVAAVGVYFLPTDLWSRLSAPAAVAVPAAKPVVAAVPVPVPVPVPAPALAVQATPALELPTSAPLLAKPAAASAPEAALGAAPASMPAPTRAPTAVPAALPAVALAEATAGLVQLRTTKASWVEARDARGATLLSRTVLPGESVALDGRLPIRMTIGNASATQLAFRGNPVDLTPSTRDNIARVQLQ